MLPHPSPGFWPWLPHHTLGTGAYLSLAFWEFTVTTEHSAGKGQSRGKLQAAFWEQFLTPSCSL